MQIQRHLIAAATALFFTAPAFSAAVISTESGSATTTNGWGKIGQTFTATGDASLLQDWTFNLAARTGGGSILFSVFDWDGSNTGTSLFSQTLAWNAAGGRESVLNMNLTLIAGQTYVAVVDLLGYTGASVSYTNNLYAGGEGVWNNGNWNSYGLDTIFNARFGATAADTSASAVPEPTSFALFGIAALGLVMTSRRRKQQQGV